MGSWLMVGLLLFDSETSEFRGRVSDVALLSPLLATVFAVAALCCPSRRWRRRLWVAFGVAFGLWAGSALTVFFDVVWWNPIE